MSLGPGLRKAFRDAVMVDELISSNPVERTKRPHAQLPEPGTVWTVAQLRVFLDTAARHRLGAFFHVAAYTGARRGELLNLRWPDVDLEAKRLTITGSTAVIAGERIDGTTKSGRTRVVSIDDGTVDVLRQHKADQAANQLKAGDSWRGVKDGYVFTTGWGEPIYPDTVTSLMTKLIHATTSLSKGRRPRANSRTPGCTTYGTSTPRLFCCPAYLSMSWPSAWATPTRPSPSGSTPTSSAPPRPPPRTSSPRP
jgi:integrase